MKTAALSFSSISTPSPHHSRSLSPSPTPFHSRCSLSISLPTLVVSRALGHSLPLGLTSLTLSAVSSPIWNSHHHRLRHRAGLDNWSAV
ncbi:hypothetical protein Sjap_006585 [Stephania japonica]|uniref:Uncharacterized protein n=1 Tax=Stephania japonica TaxID=461633 RepID=A0AAP0K652_9MAGN